MASAEHKDNGSHILLDDSSLKTNDTIVDLKLARKTSRKIKKQKQREAPKQRDKGSCHLHDNSSLETDTTTMQVNYSLKTDTNTNEVNSLGKDKKRKKRGKTVEHKDKGPNFYADHSSLKTDAIIEDLELGFNQSGAKKKNKPREVVVPKDKGSHFSLNKSPLNIDASSNDENSLQNQKGKRKKEQVEHADKGSHVSPDNSSLKTDATKEVKSPRKQKRKRKKKKQGKDIEHRDKDPNLPVDNSSLKTDATSKEVTLSQAQKGERKKKQGKSVDHKKDKGSHISLDNSSLEIHATTEERNLSRKRKRERNNKKQGKAIEHKPDGSHLLVDNSSLKNDATIEDPSHEHTAPTLLDLQQTVEQSSKKKNKKRKRKKAKHHDIENIVNSCGPPNDGFLSKASTEEINSSEKRKRKRKNRKQGKAIEHKPNGSHLLVDNSSLNNDATLEDPLQEDAAPTLLDSEETVEHSSKKKNKKRKRKKAKHHDIENGVNSCGNPNDAFLSKASTEEINSSQKRKRKRKNKKQRKAIEHKPNGSHLLVDNSSLKTEATIEDPLQEHTAPTLLDSQETLEHSSKKKNKKRKRKKAKHHDIENIVNSCGPPNDAFLTKASTPALHTPAKHLIQFVTTDSVREQSCVETDNWQGENEEREHPMRKEVAENNNVECDVQKLSCTHNTFVPDADCSVNESVLKVVELNKDHSIIDSSFNHKDNNDFIKNANPKKDHVNSTVQLMSEAFKSDKSNLGTEKVNSNHGINGCHPSPVLQLEEANGTQLDCTDTTRNDMICEAGNAISLSLVSKTGGQSEIPHLPVGGTITCKHYSKNKLLILDVNGLLADFTDKVPKGSKRPDIYINQKKVYKRPFCDDFIQFCLNKFHVGVWSSRVKKNLDRAVKFLFGKSASKLLFCWNQYQCTKTKSFTLEDKHKPLVFKDLRKLWDKTIPNLPWEKGEFNESNTLLLDDSPYKALLNPRCTAIFPHSYHFDNIGDRSLARDGDLRIYLEGLARAENVREYVSENPFGQEPITETSPSWNFYSKIIEAVKRRQNDAEIQATSSRKRSNNDMSSLAMDQGTAAKVPPQLTEALPPLTTGDPPQQAGALPPLATSDPLQQSEVLPAPPSPTGDLPQQTNILLPPATTAIPP